MKTPEATTAVFASPAIEASASASVPSKPARTKKAGGAKPAKTAKTAAPKKARKAADKSKVEIVAKLLLRDGGCTGKEILAATGWPTVSVPQQAKAANLKLRKEKKKGEVTRYFGTAKA